MPFNKTPKMSFSKNSQSGPGRLFIINHMDFIKKSKRKGSDKDVELLRKHFGLYQVPSKEILNPTLEEVQKEMKKLQNHDFSKSSCFVCAILSHGSKNNIILSSDDKPYSLDDDIVEPIQRNKTLFGKPKIFIVQACKGATEIDLQRYVVQEKNLYSADCTNCTHTNCTDSANCTESSNQRDPGKCWKFCSTCEDFVSYRHKIDGSIFITSFCAMLKKHGNDRSIEEIFDLASKKIEKKCILEVGKIQIPCKTINDPTEYIFGDYCRRS